MLEGLAANAPLIIWPESARQHIETCGPVTDERQQCLIREARQKKSGMRAKGAYM